MPGDPDTGRAAARHSATGPHRLSRLREHVVPILVLGAVSGVGAALIDWPPFAEVDPRQYWGYASVLLFPLGYLLLWWTASRIRRGEVVGLGLGLVYGGVLWAQTIFDLCFLNGLGAAESLDYVAGHGWDLFTVAAVVGVVGYFSAGPNRTVRMISLALVLALTGTISGASEAEFLWAHGRPLAYPYWVLVLLWALTGAWYGLCVGFRPPSPALTRALRGEETELPAARRANP
jgi:hypothetical protein